MWALLMLTAGCGSGGPDPRRPESSERKGMSPTRAFLPVVPLPAASTEAYRLPWGCGESYAVNQGNHGDICGVHGDHVGVQEYAWDFGLPLRTPVLASRAGVVTLAIRPSPAGS